LGLRQDSNSSWKDYQLSFYQCAIAAGHLWIYLLTSTYLQQIFLLDILLTYFLLKQCWPFAGPEKKSLCFVNKIYQTIVVTIFLLQSYWSIKKIKQPEADVLSNNLKTKLNLFVPKITKYLTDATFKNLQRPGVCSDEVKFLNYLSQRTLYLDIVGAVGNTLGTIVIQAFARCVSRWPVANIMTLFCIICATISINSV